MQLTNKVFANNPATTLVNGSFRPNGTGTPDTTVETGLGHTVTRIGVGHYRATFTKAFPGLIAAQASVRHATQKNVTVTMGDYSATNKTIDFFISQQAPGFHQFDLAAARIMASNDTIGVNATDGGLLSLDTTPDYKALTSAKEIGIIWAAANVEQVLLGQFVYPPDFDNASDLTVNFLAARSATDSPVLTVRYLEGINDTDIGGNTGTITASTIAEKSVTIAAAGLGAHPNVATVTVTPGTHGTATINVYGAWIEYVRKLSYDPSSDADNVVNFSLAFQNSDLPVR